MRSLVSQAHRWRLSLSRAAMLFLFALVTPVTNGSLVDVSSPTSGWTPIRYGGSNGYDPTVDQQTGSAEGDLVGNATHASVYSFFGDANTPSTTDGTLAFRLRLGADTNPTGFKTAAFVGIITDRASGKIDLFLGVNNSGSADSIGIYSPGSGLNISPSTTTIVSPPLISYVLNSSNYNWGAVTSVMDPTATNFDLDAGGQTDYFLTFAIPFSDIINQLAARGIGGVNENTQFSYVIATSTQGNSLNQDLNGVGKNYNTASTWGTLGALADSTAPIAAVPEVNPTMLVVLLALVVIASRHRAQWKPALQQVRVAVSRSRR